MNRYHQRVGAQGCLLAVEQDQSLAGAGHPYLDPAVESGEIEPMHRLAEFEQDIVGDIHHRTDGA